MSFPIKFQFNPEGLKSRIAELERELAAVQRNLADAVIEYQLSGTAVGRTLKERIKYKTAKDRAEIRTASICREIEEVKRRLREYERKSDLEGRYGRGSKQQ